MSVLLVLGVPVALHLLLRGGVPDEQRRLAIWAEVGVALAAAVAGAWMLAFALFDEHVVGGVYTSSDFTEYCSIVSRLRGEDWPEHSQRSLLAGWPSAQLAGRGLLDGMALSGLLFSGLFTLGLYLWGRALQGPVAGLAAVLLAGTLAPIALLSHDLSFYPEVVAVFTLGAAATCAALRWRGWPTQALLGIAIGACLLVDVKGLIWALPFTGLGLVAALARPRRAPYRLLALLLPIALSFPLGRVAYPIYASSLESQANIEQRMNELGLEFDASRLRWDTDFVWGRSNPVFIPYTLHTVWALGKGVHPDFVSGEQGAARWAWTVRGLRLEWGAGVLVLVLLLVRRRDPWLALALLGTAVPFAVGLESAQRLHQAFPRHLSTGLPFAIVWGGVAWSALLDGLPQPERAARVRGLRPLLGLALLAAMVWGLLPTSLSPAAPWRNKLSAENGDIRRMVELATPDLKPEEPARRRDRHCFHGLDRDRRDGREVAGTLYGGVVPER